MVIQKEQNGKFDLKAHESVGFFYVFSFLNLLSGGHGFKAVPFLFGECASSPIIRKVCYE
jgi:hypothetical protein